jgi:hypothetical protein
MTARGRSKKLADFAAYDFIDKHRSTQPRTSRMENRNAQV